MIDTFKPTAVSTLFGLIVLSVLLNLGVWQLNRAESKELLKVQFENRHLTLLDISSLDDPNKDLNYFRITLTGKFDNQHSLLLDNKIMNHRVGYQVLTPFSIFGCEKEILVNRGWIPQGQTREQIPAISPILGEQTVSGILTQADQGGMQLSPDVFNNVWPWRIQKLDLSQISDITKKDYYSYVLNANESMVSIHNLKPDRHIAYAVQWFALAIAFVVMFIVLSLKREK